MIQLLIAYLFASGLISVLVLLANRNRQEGWRKPRGRWQNVELSASLELVPKDNSSHMGDLVRLQQSLDAFGESTRPEPAKETKPSVLA